MTPFIPPENRLHKQSSSLVEMNKFKANFYKGQFNQRVSKTDIERIQKRRVQSPHTLRSADVTIYFPDNPGKDKSKLAGICLHVHGGGWLWGDSHNQVAHRCLEMSSHLNAAVVSVEYSLLCHDKFNPVGDTIAALEWVEYNGAKELGSEKIFVASGESSGAHLLMLAMLYRRDAMLECQLKDRWKCINLVYGVYDLCGSNSIRNDGDTSSPLCGNELLWLYDLYCARMQTHDRKSPSISPLYADLSCMPPALISVGTADPLLDDSLLMAERYSVCENDVDVALYEAGEHGIGHFGVQENEDMGDKARNYTLDFMKRHLVAY
jgi:acetyl esterase/lipase